MDNGGIYATIASQYFGNGNLYKTSSVADHAVTIIGWDDNYSKENFSDELGNMPSNDGAYIALNSWGEYDLFYISYEDVLVERDMSGVVTSTINKEDTVRQIKFTDRNLYQAIKENLENCIFKYNDEKLTMDIFDIGSYISTLNLSNRNITDITGLSEICNYINIVTLDLSNNNIEEIPDLSHLDKLFNLNLSNNPITDMNNLPNISYINLSNNIIT